MEKQQKCFYIFTRIFGIQLHWPESVMLLQHAARPLPKPAKVALAAEPVALVRDGDRVPMHKADVAARQILKDLVSTGIGTGMGLRMGMGMRTGTGMGMGMGRCAFARSAMRDAGWRRFLHSVIRQMPVVEQPTLS
jgi:hypothetical protein